MLNVLHKISSDEPQQQSEEVPLLSQATAAEEETQNSRAWRFEWTHAAILLLIAEHGNKHELFSNSAMKKAEVWGMIARVLQEHGYKVTGEACDKKWRNLKDRYKAIRKTHSQTGSGRITWDFYDLMDNQLFDDPGCMPKKTVGSMCGVTINTTRPRANSDPAPVPASPCPSTSTSSEETMTRSPSTSQSTPKRTTKRKREDEEPPRWYLEHLQKQNTALEVIAKAMEKRNEVLQNIVDAMKK